MGYRLIPTQINVYVTDLNKPPFSSEIVSDIERQRRHRQKVFVFVYLHVRVRVMGGGEGVCASL